MNTADNEYSLIYILKVVTYTNIKGLLVIKNNFLFAANNLLKNSLICKFASKYFSVFMTTSLCIIGWMLPMAL